MRTLTRFGKHIVAYNEPFIHSFTHTHIHTHTRSTAPYAFMPLHGQKTTAHLNLIHPRSCKRGKSMSPTPPTPAEPALSRSSFPLPDFSVGQDGHATILHHSFRLSTTAWLSLVTSRVTCTACRVG
mmetsp:Transcript_3508/g.9415  ORF Transcript_3508/g.9415 Transcript_3508/m.9415 type:complete len:126 (-) Transcript_3508:1270-1647(-)